MTIPTDSQTKKKDGSTVYIWVTIIAFYCCILCVTSLFCGLSLWSTQRNPASETDSADTTFVNILEGINTNPAWKPLINDEFNDNKNKWEIGPYQNDSLTLDRKIEGGKFTWEYQSKSGWYFWGFPDKPTVEDFVATVEISHLKGSPDEDFGLILRAFNDNYYLIGISELGQLTFRIYTDDKYSTLMERTASAIRVGEPNEIAVEAEGDHFRFYINRQLSGEITDDRLKRGFIGILTSTSGAVESVPNVSFNNEKQTRQSKYEVDNFKVWIPVSGYIQLEKLTPEKGRILFVSDKDGNPEIYSVNTDGTDPERLTNNKADDTSPKWSPSGDRIVFISTRDGNSEIYTMKSDGTELTRITENTFNDLDPSWSPDGKSIVFSSDRDGNYEIYTYDLESGETKRITDNLSEDRYPDWSSRDDLILYQSTQYGSIMIYLHDISTKEETRVSLRIPPYSSSRPSFSEDGSKIIYTFGTSENQTGVMVYEMDTTKNIEVVAQSVDTTNTKNSNLSPAWSPDGKQIVFTSNRDGMADIYIISSDGKSIVRVTNSNSREWDLDWTGN